MHWLFTSTFYDASFLTACRDIKIYITNLWFSEIGLKGYKGEDSKNTFKDYTYIFEKFNWKIK